MAQGALAFGAATSDVVDLGAGASLTNLDPFTLLMWIKPTTLTSLRMLYQKLQVTGNKLFRLNGTLGDVQFVVTRPTTATNYVTNSAPLANTGTWILLALTYKSAGSAGQVVNIYRGDTSVLATECTYGTATDGSGAATSDAGNVARIGNSAVLTLAMQANVACCAIFGAELTLAEVQSWQRLPRATVGANVAKAFYRFGNEGAGSQQDYSGNANTGTVSGCTQSDGVAVGGWWARRAA